MKPVSGRISPVGTTRILPGARHLATGGPDRRRSRRMAAPRTRSALRPTAAHPPRAVDAARADERRACERPRPEESHASATARTTADRHSTGVVHQITGVASRSNASMISSERPVIYLCLLICALCLVPCDLITSTQSSCPPSPPSASSPATAHPSRQAACARARSVRAHGAPSRPAAGSGSRRSASRTQSQGT